MARGAVDETGVGEIEFAVETTLGDVGRVTTGELALEIVLKPVETADGVETEPLAAAAAPVGRVETGELALEAALKPVEAAGELGTEPLADAPDEAAMGGLMPDEVGGVETRGPTLEVVVPTPLVEGLDAEPLAKAAVPVGDVPDDAGTEGVGPEGVGTAVLELAEEPGLVEEAEAKTFAEELAPFADAPDEAATEEAATEEAVAEEAVAEEATAEEAALVEVGPEEAAPEEAAPEEAVPEETGPEEAIPEEAAPEEVNLGDEVKLKPDRELGRLEPKMAELIEGAEKDEEAGVPVADAPDVAGTGVDLDEADPSKPSPGELGRAEVVLRLGRMGDEDEALAGDTVELVNMLGGRHCSSC